MPTNRMISESSSSNRSISLQVSCHVRQRSLVEAWAELRQEELLRAWQRLQSGNVPQAIDPLE
ncbi:MAG: DUF4160 domain-containing protein [Pirellulales bacterium]|nr:DUF4160 domain-containing protein [Pirellulales bacterium]